MNDQLAVIFDMDGVVVNNYHFHQKAWNQFCESHNIILDNDFQTKVFGGTNKEHLEVFFNRKLSANEILTFEEAKEKIYRDLYSPFIEPVAGLKELLDHLKSNKVPVSLATSAPKVNVDFVLDKTELLGYFDTILDASFVEKGKPNPEIYIKAARSLDTEPSDCIVIEDSLNGIQAAQLAGMKVIGITTTLPENKLQHVDLIIKDFHQLNIEQLRNLI